MTDSIPFSPARDALWRDVALDHVAELHVFGVPLRVESNSPYVVERALVHFPPCASSPAGVTSARAPARLRVVVETPRGPIHAVDSPQWRLPYADHALFRAPGMVGMLDLAAADGIIYVEEAYARFRTQFDQTVLRGPILTLVTRRDRHPIHAAAIRKNDAALLLLGPSGVGKSTTCFVASRAGIDVLSDDSIRVQRLPEFRVWGTPGRIHLLDDAAARFASVDTLNAVRVTPNGRRKHVVRLEAGTALPPYVHRARVCLLRRGGDTVACALASPDEIFDAIVSAPEVESDFYPSGRFLAARALAAPGGWTLTLSANPEDSVPLLRSLLAQT